MKDVKKGILGPGRRIMQHSTFSLIFLNYMIHPNSELSVLQQKTRQDNSSELWDIHSAEAETSFFIVTEIDDISLDFTENEDNFGFFSYEFTHKLRYERPELNEFFKKYPESRIVFDVHDLVIDKLQDLGLKFSTEISVENDVDYPPLEEIVIRVIVKDCTYSEVLSIWDIVSTIFNKFDQDSVKMIELAMDCE